VSLKNILVGDVFLCSGQSNMQLPLKEVQGGAQASESAHQFKMLRLLLVPKQPAAEPNDQIKAKWTQCTPDSVANISAVAFFFADALRKSPAMKDVPIGLIDSSFGGTCVEGWISSQTLAKSYKQEDLRDSMFGIKPANLYNAMIAPLVPLNIKGVLWYQGESNAPKAELYDKLLTTMIEEWRGKFQSPELPFFSVQLPNYPGVMEGSSFVWIRGAQAKVAASVPRPRGSLAIVSRCSRASTCMARRSKAPAQR
jgi:sialate O-acetylesterase